MPISDRIALVQIKAFPRHINTIKVYATTAEKLKHKIELFYIDKKCIKIHQKIEDNIVMGDFSEKIIEDMVGGYVLGKWNERGDSLV